MEGKGGVTRQNLFEAQTHKYSFRGHASHSSFLATISYYLDSQHYCRAATFSLSTSSWVAVRRCLDSGYQPRLEPYLWYSQPRRSTQDYAVHRTVFCYKIVFVFEKKKKYLDVFGATICSYSTLLLANTFHFDPQPDPAPSISRKRCRVT
jgi:hypothetical protein